MAARTLAAMVAVAAGIALIPGSAQTGQKTFATPQEAAQALVDAAAANDAAAMLQIFGPGGKDIVQSGDAAEDKASREQFAALARQKMQVETDEDHDRATIIVGPDDWPMPVPIVLDKGKWRFDPAVGRVEVLARRVGRNELTAIEVCRAYVEAQMEYASRDRTASGVLQYAQKILSAPGKKDGLYWEGEPDNLVPKAFADASAAMLAGQEADALSRLLLPHPESTGSRCGGRRNGLRGERQNDRRLRAGCVSGRIWSFGHTDVPGEPSRQGLRKGSRLYDGRAGPADDAVQSG